MKTLLPEPSVMYMRGVCVCMCLWCVCTRVWCRCVSVMCIVWCVYLCAFCVCVSVVCVTLMRISGVCCVRVCACAVSHVWSVCMCMCVCGVCEASVSPAGSTDGAGERGPGALLTGARRGPRSARRSRPPSPTRLPRFPLPPSASPSRSPTPGGWAGTSKDRPPGAGPSPTWVGAARVGRGPGARRGRGGRLCSPQPRTAADSGTFPNFTVETLLPPRSKINPDLT